MSSLTNVVTAIYAYAPSGSQFKEIGKAAKKAAPYIDDVARAAVQNKGFLASIPVWVWVIIGIVLIAGVIYYIREEC